jgi:ribonuclease HII
MPDFSIEDGIASKLICGIDEAGRGPLAGPVVAGAVIFPRRINIHPAIHDSKRLSAKMRETLYDYICANAIWAIGIASVAEIDTHNILNATMLAMQRAAEGLKTPASFALIDGNRAPKLYCPSQCVVKGDQLSVSIAAASIMAKVTRDAIMRELDQQYPQYAFARHAGYGTKVHMAALVEHGACEAHRKSFAPVRAVLQDVA